MADSDTRTRLSVAFVDVVEGKEAQFLALDRHVAQLLVSRGYGCAETLRDEAEPRRYYAVRRWTDAAAAEACLADLEMQALTARLHQVARVTEVVNGVRRRETLRLVLDDCRVWLETDRRAGFDRRMSDRGRPEKERRRGRERRLGPRRLRDRSWLVDLVSAARQARERAEAPFSTFKVGAALETSGGAVITGCNIENATYGLTMCAERVAMFKALSEGYRAFKRLVIVADTPTPTPPCGACRQILWEFGGNLEVVLADLEQERGRHRLTDLLPMPFDARLLAPGDRHAVSPGRPPR